MATKAVKRKREQQPDDKKDWQGIEERAPSILRNEQVAPIRWIAIVSLMIGAVGGMALVMAAFGRAYLIGQGPGLVLLMLGVAGLLFHAFSEKELIYRRIYGAIGAALLLCGVLFSFIRTEAGFGGLFLSIGAPSLALALCFLLSYARNETEELYKVWTVRALGIAGALMAATGLIGGILSEDFLLGRGVVYLILGLLYVAAFIGMQPIGSTVGYWAGFALGVVGVVMMVLALGRALPFEGIPGVGDYLTWINRLFAFLRWPAGSPAAPFLFAYLGLEFLLLSVGVCSDSQLVTLTRRELASYFYSPIAYIVLVALTFLGGVSFLWFIWILHDVSSPSPFQPGAAGAPEPILRFYIFNFFPVICVLLMVPIVTMRLLAEENRLGTLEVLLTAPVRESTVVLSKFLAAFRFYLLAWYPWGLYLIALWAEGGESFDYRPVMSFALALFVTGANFVGMGLFLSSLTRNQIAAAILTFMAMVVYTAFFFLKEFIPESSAWHDIFLYLSFFDLWRTAAGGLVVPRYLLFHVTAAAFWLFLSVKVLESRKWR
jgi:ABC-2 type transport system permease protein